MAKGKLRHIHIEPADKPAGGAQVILHHEPPKVQKLGASWGQNETKINAMSPEEAGEHVTKALKAHASANSNPAKQGNSQADDTDDLNA